MKLRGRCLECELVKLKSILVGILESLYTFVTLTFKVFVTVHIQHITQ